MIENESGLLKKAERLMELRGYQVEDLQQGKEAINIKASKQDSDQSVLIHIVTKSDLKSNGVGIEKVRAVEQSLEKEDVDKIIVFGNKFTDSSSKHLRENSIEFFSQKRNIVSSLNLQELYLKIFDCVKALCQIKCGGIPESEAECKGFSETPIESPIRGGTGSRKTHYSCMVRLISDNSDFHFEHKWIRPLQQDLLSLLKILQVSKLEAEKQLPQPLAQAASIATEVSS